MDKSKPMGELINPNSNNNNNNNNNRVRSKEMENISFEISKYPRDLLQKLISLKNDNEKNNNNNDEEENNEEGLNLGLGLSLGGKFGIDKYNNDNKSGGLMRSSSIASAMPLIVGQQPLEVRTGAGGASLVRTSSLPVETEEEWRKRKEMQSLRRMEAKRRRSEKQRGGGGGGGGGVVEDKSGVESLKFRGRLEREQQSLGLGGSKFVGGTVPVTSNNNSGLDGGKGRRTTFGSLQGFLNAQGHGQVGQGGLMGIGQGGQGQGSSQGSGESLGGGNSSGASELESKAHQASSSGGEARSPASIQSLQERSSQEALGSPGTNKGDTSQIRGSSAPGTSKQPKASESKRQETGSSSGIEDMPCVFTIGDGPNGRKVEGILYRYGKGEQVRIMCVCHGTFLSPQDFVKHAGGTDVEHPLRHIVVSPSSSVFQ